VGAVDDSTVDLNALRDEYEQDAGQVRLGQSRLSYRA
jgi:hypothetical protein